MNTICLLIGLWRSAGAIAEVRPEQHVARLAREERVTLVRTMLLGVDVLGPGDLERLTITTQSKGRRVDLDGDFTCLFESDEPFAGQSFDPLLHGPARRDVARELILAILFEGGRSSWSVDGAREILDLLDDAAAHAPARLRALDAQLTDRLAETAFMNRGAGALRMYRHALGAQNLERCLAPSNHWIKRTLVRLIDAPVEASVVDFLEITLRVILRTHRLDGDPAFYRELTPLVRRLHASRNFARRWAGHPLDRALAVVSEEAPVGEMRARYDQVRSLLDATSELAPCGEQLEIASHEVSTDEI